MSVRDFVTNPRNFLDINRAIRRALRSRRRESPTARRILLVEEEAWSRKTLARILEHAGYEVVPAGSGSQAVAILGHQFVDLVVADVALAHADGVELVRRLHDEQPALRIVAIASQQDSERELEATFAVGATRTVTAPFEGRRLVDAIRDLLGR
jgi:two-component system, OmpR family, response regulator